MKVSTGPGFRIYLVFLVVTVSILAIFCFVSHIVRWRLHVVVGL